MSNYLVMLENHLAPEQSAAVARLQTAASDQGMNLFLSGRSTRDMFAGARVRDLDFVVEGSASKLARTLTDATVTEANEISKSAMLLFPSGVEARILTAREETYARAGGKPKLNPSGIHEHLQTRDFTIHAIALSLSRASRGLLLDPTNGLSDLTQRELRAVGKHSLHDVPARLLQLIRLKAQLGFTIAAKTQAQYTNARTEALEKHIAADAILEELRQAARDPNPLPILEAWAAEGLLSDVSPALSGPRLNAQGFARLAKARQALPFDIPVQVDDFALFLYVLAEKLSPKERAELVAKTGLGTEAVEGWQKLEARSAKLGKEVAAATKPSKVWLALRNAPAERALLLLMTSTSRAVTERIRNYFSRYLQTAAEVTDEEVAAAAGAAPGAPKFERRKVELIAKRLDARPKRVVEEPTPEEA
ncbi:MAG TPA: hypothetical protein VES20_00990 [Bryobacteraceae bacterium]|nr:hypothetical protein [Bryobacteraceae bacterium]